jgi:hypothetical protein
MKRPITILLAPVLCGVLLLGILGEARTRVGPETTEPYHRMAKAAIDAVPNLIGTWTGMPEKVPDEALKLLRDPDILSRKYVDTDPLYINDRSRWASVLIVHCRDTRDLNGHYPPKCYPNNGQTEVYRKDHDWEIKGVKIPGREYHFYKNETTRVSKTCVYNFLIAPGVGIVRDMDDVAKAAEDYQQRYFGASQIQIVMSADLPEQQRLDIFNSLVSELIDCVRTLESGGLKND